mmetsp:Transcript_9320/g.23442  ORF Transcript_9320/g.23442 Transcript_9320/m.23442 type:complete len:244 (-) Transcript_9320:34-765(-)
MKRLCFSRSLFTSFSSTSRSRRFWAILSLRRALSLASSSAVRGFFSSVHSEKSDRPVFSAYSSTSAMHANRRPVSLHLYDLTVPSPPPPPSPTVPEASATSGMGSSMSPSSPCSTHQLMTASAFELPAMSALRTRTSGKPMATTSFIMAVSTGGSTMFGSSAPPASLPSPSLPSTSIASAPALALAAPSLAPVGSAAIASPPSVLPSLAMAMDMARAFCISASSSIGSAAGGGLAAPAPPPAP